MFLRHLVLWPPIDIQVNFYVDRPRRTPLSGELNTKGVAEYIHIYVLAIFDLSNAIPQKRCKIGAKLAVISTNRKLHMSSNRGPLVGHFGLDSTVMCHCDLDLINL